MKVHAAVVGLLPVLAAAAPFEFVAKYKTLDGKDGFSFPVDDAPGVRLMYLPPYSHDLNPIEPAWALQKQHVRKHAPRTSTDLVRVAHRARRRVTARHCRGWFSHSGYTVNSSDR
ncbi:MAG: transposase, partial [Myxococcaceae bacterium]|nr:transposase [Myxococcaceae bacterium]